ncbi:GNAT family N-acetyltransferase [Natronomonas sp. F2-12]|jgi:putative acetyltransferase|uniref:GNAT family N-acetyltransferase n=1 Tax=Natronomonas aquatica TaxID=2841590 RepID=A0A9R1CTU8_9EURY|nr:N-acetyltransferase [Natronomonas aquatica]MCQ4333800.1 GNAT family N-acetyltransferase [Natronomonas aquatica]
MIRPMTAADTPAVRALQTHLVYADPDLVEAAVDGPFHGRVAVDDGPVGYAIAFPGSPANLSELAVAPEHRRCGHGRALVEAAIVAVGAEGETIAVTTPADDTAARRFYTAIGFEPDGRLPGFYSDGADALRFVRRE